MIALTLTASNAAQGQSASPKGEDLAGGLFEPARPQPRDLPSSSELKRNKSKTKKPLTFDHLLSFAEGLYPRDDSIVPAAQSQSTSGVTVDYYLRVGARILHKEGARKLSLSAEYTHDPFTLRTFSFEPDEQLDRTARIVQMTDEVRGTFVWRQRLRRMLRSALWVRGGARFAESTIFDRRDGGLRYDLKMGRTTGPRGLLSLEGRALFYPNYLVNGRRLDQWLFRTHSTVGHRWGSIVLVEVSYQFSFNPYMDSRYDTIDSGVVVPAAKSKSHLNHRIEPSVGIEPVEDLRIDVVYRYERNDSRNYNREMSGNLPDLTRDARYMENYYGFTRHRLGLRANWEPVEKFRMMLGGAIWRRNFDTYEARNLDNVWLGERRRDQHLGIDYELGYRAWSKGSRKDVLNAGLWIIAFGAYDRRVSNMTRDVSFATNYEVARIYFGFQLENL